MTRFLRRAARRTLLNELRARALRRACYHAPRLRILVGLENNERYDKETTEEFSARISGREGRVVRRRGEGGGGSASLAILSAVVLTHPILTSRIGVS